MEKYLGIDYGRKKIGVAVGDNIACLAEPYCVVKVGDVYEAVEKVIKVIKVITVIKVIVGISEGKSALEARKFGKFLKEKTGLEIIFQDETLTTKEAQLKSIEAGIKRSKRKNMEDAYSATLILQNYLDSHP